MKKKIIIYGMDDEENSEEIAEEIAEALAALGIDKPEVNVKGGYALVYTDVDDDEIIDAIEELGFEVDGIIAG
jgi:flavodoxin